MNNYCYHNCLCIYTIITLLCIRSHICSFILRFSYISIIHILIYHLVLSTIYHECIYALLYSYIHIYSLLYSYFFISFIHHILYAFLSEFSYSCTFYISIMYAFTHSYIHICTYHSCTCTHSYSLSSFAYLYCSYHLCLPIMCS